MELGKRTVGQHTPQPSKICTVPHEVTTDPTKPPKPLLLRLTTCLSMHVWQPSELAKCIHKAKGSVPQQESVVGAQGQSAHASSLPDAATRLPSLIHSFVTMGRLQDRSREVGRSNRPVGLEWLSPSRMTEWPSCTDC